jgi:hypothetical protein
MYFVYKYSTANKIFNIFSGEFFHTSHWEPGTQILTPASTLRGEVAAEVVKVAKVAYRY